MHIIEAGGMVGTTLQKVAIDLFYFVRYKRHTECKKQVYFYINTWRLLYSLKLWL